ncbi:MAG: hypothetical protein II510_06280 [Erysipelotrichales bacterium]|nr:hypothetical protein [Erysipelotrichales bacterium]
MLRVEIRCPLEDKRTPIEKLVRQYGIKEADIRRFEIVHQSLDARNRAEAAYVYQIELDLKSEEYYRRRLGKNASSVKKYEYRAPKPGSIRMNHRPVIIGFGPAGMAAGYLLAKKGYCPLILERGPSIEDRREKVETYWKTGILDTEGNVQFGEGGAGAFSDGKLTTRIKDDRVRIVLKTLVKYGADESVAWMNHPHIGTDRLRIIDKNIRRAIEEYGGTVRFHTKAEEILVHKGKITGVRTAQGEEIPCETVLMGIGHSARDTFRMLEKAGIPLEAKPFAVGVRVEHTQRFINENQYRNIRFARELPPAEYFLTHTSSNGKGAYSFCMCPGGYVVPSASEKDTIVTNGMSYSSRDGVNANAAILVQVNSSDYGTGLFDGVKFQEELEKRAFLLGQGKAPAQLVEDYLKKTASKEIGKVQPTYAGGIRLCDLHECFSSEINRSLEEFFVSADKTIPGFASNGAVMTGVESRSSSPIRIVRDLTTRESAVSGLYPIGEGAGYAGGIMSSVIDGLRSAEMIIAKFAKWTDL